MRVLANEARVLADFIKEEIEKNFENVHLSGNLMDTIEIKITEDGFEIVIPAQMYDLEKYFENKVIVYTGKGSYADKVNISGGFSGKHKGYVDIAIDKAVTRWTDAMSNKYEMVSKRG